MSWSYDPTAPGFPTDTDQVRLLIGDTNASDPLLSNEEIAAMLVIEGSVDLAAARAAETLATVFVRQADEVTDDLGQRVKYGNRAAVFRQLALSIRTQVSVTATVPISTYAKNQGVW